ncbi:MAG: ArsR family transcriptional regulator [Planctomycetes bacterium]|nr:ArsR family transcriptional regulator [Planctomycetota bacterium]
MLKFLIERREATVSEIASAMKVRGDLASRYLRALNARGLLKARSAGRFVYYRLGADESIPSTRPLLESLKRSLTNRRIRIQTIFCLLTAFTHPRRLRILSALQDRPCTIGQLKTQTGIPEESLRRHLMKLVRRDFVIHARHTYQCRRPETPLARTLLMLALDSKS